MRMPEVSRPLRAVMVGVALLLVGCAQSSATKAPAMPSPPAPPSAPQTNPGSASAPREGSGEKPVEAGKKATAKSEAAKEGQKGDLAATGEAVAGQAKTPDERRSVVEGQLQASMAEFDRMLLKEQKALEEKQRQDPLPERGEGAGGAGTGKAGSAEGGAGGDGKTGSTDAGAGKGSAGKAGSTENQDDRTPAERRAEAEARKGKEGDTGTGESRDGGRLEGGAPVTAPVEGGPAGPGSDSSTAPKDVGDGRNDDVVARQLREAAMKEKDPAIRAKLWDEYREYKKGAGKGGA